MSGAHAAEPAGAAGSGPADLPVYTVAELDAVAPFDVPSFTKEDAYELGTIAAALIRERGLDLAVDVVLIDDPDAAAAASVGAAGSSPTDGLDLVFRAKLGSTGPGNDPWLAGKAAAVRMFQVPSLLVRLRHEEAGTPFEQVDDRGIDHSFVRAHGGSIPIFVAGVLAGTITTSGEPDVVDHQTASDAVAAYLAGRHA